jgi:hypothetical protein
MIHNLLSDCDLNAITRMSTKMSSVVKYEIDIIAGNVFFMSPRVDEFPKPWRFIPQIIKSRKCTGYKVNDRIDNSRNIERACKAVRVGMSLRRTRR